MQQHTPCDQVVLGLRIKSAAMWSIPFSLVLGLLTISYLGLFIAVLLPLTIDFVGRCYTAQCREVSRLAIRWSIAAQGTGIIGLVVLTGMFWDHLGAGVMLGTIWAVLFQFPAARLFVQHLQEIAVRIGRPDLNARLGQLGTHLLATTLSFYGGGTLVVVILAAAIFFGLAAFGIGLVLTIPAAFLFIMPIILTMMVFTFLMLLSYEQSLAAFRQALAGMPPDHQLKSNDEPLKTTKADVELSES